MGKEARVDTSSDTGLGSDLPHISGLGLGAHSVFTFVGTIPHMAPETLFLSIHRKMSELQPFAWLTSPEGGSPGLDHCGFKEVEGPGSGDGWGETD